MPDDHINHESDNNEKGTQKIFECLGFKSIKLDRGKKTRAPDYLFKNGKINIICEVKTIISCGSDPDQGCYTLKFGERNQSLIFPVAKTIDKLNTILEDAVSQRRVFIEANAIYRDNPFFVAIFPNTITDPMDYVGVDTVFSHFPEINGILKAFKNCGKYSFLKGKSVDELKKCWERRETSYPKMDENEHWHYCINPKAIIPFDAQILGHCKYDEYSKS